MFRILTGAVIGLCLTAYSVYAGEPVSPQPVRAHLSVSGPGKLGTSIRARVAEQLEAREDTTVTDVDPHWTLQIAALQMDCPRASKGTVVVSVLIAETFSAGPLEVYLSDRLDDPTLTAVRRLTSGLFRSSRHWIESAPAEDLQGLAQGIVSRFFLVTRDQAGNTASED
jgi:hypothetical protein